MNPTSLQCVACSTLYPADGKLLTCPRHNSKYSYLEVLYDYAKVKRFPDTHFKDWRRYLTLLPIHKFHVHLNEISVAPTKLTQLDTLWHRANLYLKDETKEATGSFKDKESLINVNKALEFNIKKFFTISSGNGALSASAYATKARLPCVCFVGTHTTNAKLAMIKLFGGSIIELPGSYEDVYTKTLALKPKGWNITSGFNPYGNEGDKITAFEIWETIGVPDYVVVPCGNGGNLYGIWKGFDELKRIGKTNKIPRMIGVQVHHADPIKKALEKEEWYVELKKIPHSIAEGIIARESYTSPKTIKALRNSKGTIITVNDTEILSASKQLEKYEVIIPEITSASAFAGARKLKCNPRNKIVIILTGTGMKYLSYLKKISR